MIWCRARGGPERVLRNGILRCLTPLYSFIYLFPYSVQTDLLTAHYTSCQLEPLLYTSLPTEVAILINSSTLKSSPRQARRLWRRRRRGPRATPPSTWNNNRSREWPLTGPRFALTAGGLDAIKGPSEGTVVFPCEVAELQDCGRSWRDTITSNSFCPSKRFFR